MTSTQDILNPNQAHILATPHNITPMDPRHARLYFLARFHELTSQFDRRHARRAARASAADWSAA